MDEADLKRCTKLFGLRVFKLVEALPKSLQGRAIGNQLVRSGTSVGATTELLAGPGRRQNLFHGSEWSRKRRTRARTGWR